MPLSTPRGDALDVRRNARSSDIADVRESSASEGWYLCAGDTADNLRLGDASGRKRQNQTCLPVLRAGTINSSLIQIRAEQSPNSDACAVRRPVLLGDPMCAGSALVLRESTKPHRWCVLSQRADGSERSRHDGMETATAQIGICMV